MQEQWDKLTEAERTAFSEWQAERKAAKPKRYDDMTEAERQAFYRKIGVQRPSSTRSAR